MQNPRMQPRPKITLQIPSPQQGGFAFPMAMPRNYAGQPMTPVQGPDPSQYYNPFLNVYQNKASDFMFKQFEGFKDFTMNTAKSGLSLGEKSAFWIYNKVSRWSKKWFTHIFLCLVMLVFTVAGAAIFVAVEGVNEKVSLSDIRAKRIELVEELRMLSKEPAIAEDPETWKGEAIRRMLDFETELAAFIKQGATDKGKRVWSFWNAVFYCGTIYTTIGIYAIL